MYNSQDISLKNFRISGFARHKPHCPALCIAILIQENLSNAFAWEFLHRGRKLTFAVFSLTISLK